MTHFLSKCMKLCEQYVVIDFHSLVDISFSLDKITVLLVNVSLIQCAVPKYDKINIYNNKPSSPSRPCYSLAGWYKKVWVCETKGVFVQCDVTVICILSFANVIILGDDTVDVFTPLIKREKSQVWQLDSLSWYVLEDQN